MKITDFYDLIVYINLDSRFDRKILVEQEFQKLNINPIRISGIVPQIDNPHYRGILGCTLSHKKCLQMALEQNSNILIFEDDVKFLDNAIETIELALEEVSTMEWDMLYFGANVCWNESQDVPLKQVTNHLARLTWAQATHAYSVNKNFVSKLLHYIPNQIYPLDLVYTQTAVQNDRCYITVPMVAVQQEGFSTIEGCNIEYESFMLDRFYKKLIPLDKTF